MPCDQFDIAVAELLQPEDQEVVVSRGELSTIVILGELLWN